MSPSSVNSTNVDDEVSYALEEHKTIIPVLYRECKVPYRLRPFQSVDVSGDYARGLKSLLKSLGVEQSVDRSTPAPSGVPKESPTDVSDADERKRAAEQARLEQEREKATEQARLEDGRKQAPKPSPLLFSQFPAWAKVAVALCGILIVASVLYWALSRPRSSEQTGGAQKQPVTTPESAMDCNSVILTGNVITGTPPAHVRFTYATDKKTLLKGWGTPTTVQTFYRDGPIQQPISGLTESTTYYFRLEVTNNYGTKNINIIYLCII